MTVPLSGGGRGRNNNYLILKKENSTCQREIVNLKEPAQSIRRVTEYKASLPTTH